MTREILKALHALVIEEHLEKSEVQTWLMSLMFLQQPTYTMMQEALHLLRLPEPLKMTGWFAVSSVVHLYCSQKNKCIEEEAVENINKFFTKQLQLHWYDDVFMVHTLKAVGNMGYFTSDLRRLLNMALMRNNRDIRLAAIQAHRRIPCADLDSIDLSKLLFEHTSEDTSGEVHTFLQLLRCPTATFIQSLEVYLSEKPLSQVTSFVWNHLKEAAQEFPEHLQSSVNNILQNSLFIEKFDDHIKPSTTNTWSYRQYWLGGSVDVSVSGLFPENGFIPKAGIFKMKPTFTNGAWHDFLEVGVQVENPPSLAMEVLQPLFSTWIGGFSEFWGDARKHLNLTEETNPDGDFDISKFASYYMYIFGHELDPEVLGSMLGLTGVNTDMNRLISKLMGKRNFEVSKSFVLWNNDLNIPTSSGLPLMIQSQGVGTFKFVASGKLDIFKTFLLPPNFEVGTNLKFRTEISTTTSAIFDTGFTKNGIKELTRFTGDQHLRAFLHVKRRTINLDTELPARDKDWLSKRQKLFIVSNEDEIETGHGGFRRRVQDLRPVLGSRAQPSPVQRQIRVTLAFDDPWNSTLDVMTPWGSAKMEFKVATTDVAFVLGEASLDVPALMTDFQLKFNLKMGSRMIENLSARLSTEVAGRILNLTLELDDKDQDGVLPHVEMNLMFHNRPTDPTAQFFEVKMIPKEAQAGNYSYEIGILAVYRGMVYYTADLAWCNLGGGDYELSLYPSDVRYIPLLEWKYSPKNGLVVNFHLDQVKFNLKIIHDSQVYLNFQVGPGRHDFIELNFTEEPRHHKRLGVLALFMINNGQRVNSTLELYINGDSETLVVNGQTHLLSSKSKLGEFVYKVNISNSSGEFEVSCYPSERNAFGLTISFDRNLEIPRIVAILNIARNRLTTSLEITRSVFTDREIEISALFFSNMTYFAAIAERMSGRCSLVNLDHYKDVNNGLRLTFEMFLKGMRLCGVSATFLKQPKHWRARVLPTNIEISSVAGGLYQYRNVYVYRMSRLCNLTDDCEGKFQNENDDIYSMELTITEKYLITVNTEWPAYRNSRQNHRHRLIGTIDVGLFPDGFTPQNELLLNIDFVTSFEGMSIKWNVLNCTYPQFGLMMQGLFGKKTPTYYEEGLGGESMRLIAAEYCTKYSFSLVTRRPGDKNCTNLNKFVKSAFCSGIKLIAQVDISGQNIHRWRVLYLRLNAKYFNSKTVLKILADNRTRDLNILFNSTEKYQQLGFLWNMTFWKMHLRHVCRSNFPSERFTWVSAYRWHQNTPNVQLELNVDDLPCKSCDSRCVLCHAMAAETTFSYEREYSSTHKLRIHARNPSPCPCSLPTSAVDFIQNTNTYIGSVSFMRTERYVTLAVSPLLQQGCQHSSCDFLSTKTKSPNLEESELSVQYCVASHNPQYSLQCTLDVETTFEKQTSTFQLNRTFHVASWHEFESTFSVNWNKYFTVDELLTFALTSRSILVDYNLLTSFGPVREFIFYSNLRNDGNVEGDVKIQFNGRAYVDSTALLRNNLPYGIEILLYRPVSMTIVLSTGINDQANQLVSTSTPAAATRFTLQQLQDIQLCGDAGSSTLNMTLTTFESKTRIQVLSNITCGDVFTNQILTAQCTAQNYDYHVGYNATLMHHHPEEEVTLDFYMTFFSPFGELNKHIMVRSDPLSVKFSTGVNYTEF